MTRIPPDKETLLNNLKEGGAIPYMLDSLRVHDMQQIVFRKIFSSYKQRFAGEYPQVKNWDAFWNNYVRCAVYSSIVAVRSFCEFFGNRYDKSTSSLIEADDPKHGDNIRFSDYYKSMNINYLWNSTYDEVWGEITADEKKSLAEIYLLANKSIAHVTKEYNRLEESYHYLANSVSSLERLVDKFVYTDGLAEEYNIRMPNRIIQQ